MILPRRLSAIVALTILIGLALLYKRPSTNETWKYIQKISETNGPSEQKSSNSAENNGPEPNIPPLGTLPQEELEPHYFSGLAKPPGSNYTQTLVIARVAEESIDWIQEELPGLQTAIYTADNPKSHLHPPMNKGHEVMIYLTYIIEHYDILPDVSIFMHAHRWSWHNNDLSGHEAVQMLKSLSNERVFREGYMNLRCHWDPGCPEWMHPHEQEEDITRQEQKVLGNSWSELFPDKEMPEVLAQPCCAQFAVSRDRIQSIPFKRFVAYRDWLLRTPLSDYMSGRVWEYIWQFVFTGKNIACPPAHVCFCDGFGYCFGGEEQYNMYKNLTDEKNGLNDELETWSKLGEDRKKASEEGNIEELEKLEIPEARKDELVKGKVEDLDKRLEALRISAHERGRDPKTRAVEAGRYWEEGDGF
ncbi:MAG: hypothetical protein M1814_006122 [Vezdaea aestivalis]|nr:MAG: hypothetical protein M1814_006122 [Vezdaea aestivalis]